MSQLPFVLYLELLNSMHKIDPVKEGYRWYSADYLLFIDDLKLLTKPGDVLVRIAESTKAFF